VYSTRDKILLAFEQGPRVISGSALAARHGLTRASVWKHIKALRKEGYPIQTRKASGYTLTRPFDFSLLKGEAALGSKFWNVHYYASTASTQLLAKTAAQNGAAEGNLWITEKQTAGRGRLDRRWESGLGGLWMSMLLRPAIPPSRVPSLTLVAALSLVETIREKTHLPVKLKWPNDVVIKAPGGWRKVAGILTEMSAEVDRTQWVVIGIGVNVNNRLPNALSNRGLTLSSLLDAPLNRATLLKAYLERFSRFYRRFEKTGFEAFQRSYWRLYSRPGEKIELKTAEGVLRGVARGVDAHGALLIESHNQTKSIWEGEIVL
jgi:BirA family biotin operon repressor/biotin-[acetyl-CoA-carboxylase] ligase